jgi:hypothetical protein
MNMGAIIFWLIGYSIFSLIFIRLITRFLNFLDRIVSFSVFSESYDGSMNIEGLTYRGQCIWLFTLSCFLGFLAFTFPNPNPWGNFGFLLIFLVPGTMLLLRINTFKEDNILSETGIGYVPFKIWITSLVGGIIGFMYGFFGLGFNDLPMYIPLILIILAFISCAIPMLQDYINKFLSYDIRSKEGISFINRIITVMIAIQIIYILFIPLLK